MSMKTEETSLLWYPDWHSEMNFSTKKTDKFGKLISSVISHCVVRNCVVGETFSIKIIFDKTFF